MNEVSDFWHFSLRVYGRPGVEAACLRLQERAGLDVNLVLFACWLGTRGIRLSAERLGALEERVGPWRAAAILPLRTVRRDLKAWLEERAGGSAAIRSEVCALRERIKADELRAEKVEQLMLAAGAADFAADGAPGRELVRENLARLHDFADDPEARRVLEHAAL